MRIPKEDLERIQELIKDIDNHLITAKDKRFNDILRGMREMFTRAIKNQEEECKD